METVLIADDEKNIREGIKCIIDWEELGFKVCGEADNGEISRCLSSQDLRWWRMPESMGITENL